MPNEATIARMMDIFTEVIDLGGVEERTAIVPNLSITDAAPTGLTGFVIVQDDRDGDNVLAKTVPGVVYANNDKVNVLFVKGTEPIAFQQGSESPSADLWEIVPSTSTDIFYDKGNVGIGVTTPQSLLDINGDVLLSGGLQDYLFTDRSNFLELQSQTAATTFALELFSNDGDGTDDVNLNIFAVGLPSNVTNRERLQVKYEATGTQFEIFTEANGTGTLRPLVLYTEGNADQLHLDIGGDVGIGNAAPQATVEISAAVNPTLRLSEGSSTTSYLNILDRSATQIQINKVSNSGTAIIDINPQPVDGTSQALFRFFRETNTSGNVSFQVFRGDNTATIDAQISADDLDTYFSIPTTASVGIGTASPAAKLAVDQASTTGAIPVALFNQADVSEEIFEFVSTIGVGNAIEAIGAKTLTTTHFIKVTLPGGLTRYFPVGTIA